MRCLIGLDRKGPVSQEDIHDKDPSLLTGHKGPQGPINITLAPLDVSVWIKYFQIEN